MSTVGFPDSTVRESRDRVRAAIRNAGLAIPVALITGSLACRPAEGEEMSGRLHEQAPEGGEEVLARPLDAGVRSARLAVHRSSPYLDGRSGGSSLWTDVRFSALW